MRQLQGRLSRQDTVLVALVAVALLLNLFIRFNMAQQVTAQDELSALVRRARIALERAQEDADLGTLQDEKKDLEQAIGSVAPLPPDSSEITLKLWDWAEASTVELNGLHQQAGSAMVGKTAVITFIFTLQAQGSAESLHHFLALITASPYAPVVDSLSLKPAQDTNSWEMTLDIVVYIPEGAAG